MRGGGNSRFNPGNLDALNALLDSASAALSETRTDKHAAAKSERPSTRPLTPILDTERTGIIFTGNPHEAVPRRLLLDNRLTPLERNAWQVFRLLLNDDGLTSFPTYEQLRPYLASTPFKLASRETVAKALTALRMTRWLSLGGRVRDESTGQMKGNIYLLHDEPVSIAEAVLLDSGYLELIAECVGHSNKSIRDVAAHVFEELATDPYLRENALPSHLEKLQQRMVGQGWTNATIAQAGASESVLSRNESELSEKTPVRSHVGPSSDSELSRKACVVSLVRNPNSSSTNTHTDVCKNTVPRAREDLRLPEQLLQLASEQRRTVMVALGSIQPGLQQKVLDQWAARCVSAEVRNPAGYLFGMIQKAQRGEFNQGSDNGGGNRPPNARSGSGSAVSARVPHLSETLIQRDKPTSESLLAGREGMNAIMELLRSGPRP
ncbi:STY4528 family pathogenicity island replication protein [Pseudomonas sp. Y39-6]|uniref:STY4528 family pathogenicity island replication protein n=1 Tax=Pseudomonas sp. Y39-6 TaxID=2749807 RepID=UPI0022A7AE16|nr:STY4528 family pathogenicity island replication protein [Pseudomonas sp. Y39-6]